MYSWGEDWLSGFRLKHGTHTADDDLRVHLSKPSFTIRDLSVNHRLLTFIKANGDALIIRTNEGEEVRRERSKQKFVHANIEAVCCSDGDVTLITQAGTLKCVDATHTPFSFSTPEALCNIPVRQIACGSQHTIVLTRDGDVFTWGQDSRGQLGLGKHQSAVPSPTRLRSLSAIPVVQVAAGGEHSIALSVSGGVFSWGRNHCGQLGLGDTTDRQTPTPVAVLKMKKSIYVSCGRSHTAIMTKDGAVFTFGCGQYGQLGHNSSRDEVRPRMVAELWGAKVTKIACGSHHTLVLTDSNRVYSFGCDERGQLGRGKETHPSVPLPVQLPHDSTSNRIIQNIYAGGDSSFALCTPEKEVLAPSNNIEQNKIPQNSIEFMIDKSATQFNMNLSCLNQSFLDHSKDRHFQTSAKYSGLDLKSAIRGFRTLMKRGLLSEFTEAVLKLLPTIDNEPLEVEGLRVFLILVELLHVLLKHNGSETQEQQALKLAETLAASLQSLSAHSRQMLEDWWSTLSSSTLIRHVKVWKMALSWMLCLDSLNSAHNILLILQTMYNLKKIPETTFSLELSNDFLREDWLRWQMSLDQLDTTCAPLILGTFDFVLDLESKKMLLDFSINYQQNRAQGFFPYLLDDSQLYFQLWLKRASFVEDTFQQLAATDVQNLQKQLVVQFDGHPEISNVYKTDFFHHFFRDLVSTKSGMFMFNDSGTLVWFPSKRTEADNGNFYLFGIVCGLALYNRSIIYLPFPLVLFKKLLDIKPSLDDMMEFSPTVGQCLRDTLDYDECLNDLDIYFEISWDGEDVELDPQNPGKQVTSQNKKEFVDAYVNHAFNTSVQSLFQEFERGFFQVCNRHLLRMFQPQELQGLMIGQDVYDWVKLKQNAIYRWPYYPYHPNIQRFWDVFDELTEEQKKDFLWFVTGYRGVPVLGMDQIQLKTQIMIGSDDQHFPGSHTCYSLLELPLYSSKEIMQQRLTEALKPDRGFSKDSSERRITQKEEEEEEEDEDNNSCTSSPALHSASELILNSPEHTLTPSPDLFLKMKQWWLCAYALLNQGVAVLWSVLRGSFNAAISHSNSSGSTH